MPYQGGIKLMLADELAQAVPDFGAAVTPVDRLWRELLRLSRGLSSLREGPDFLDRADTDAVGLAQGPVDRPGLRDTHLGAVDQRRDIGGIRIAVADEAFASPTSVDNGPK